MKKLMGVVFAMFLATSVMADPFLEDTIALAKHKFQKEQVMYQASLNEAMSYRVIGVCMAMARLLKYWVSREPKPSPLPFHADIA